MNVTKNKKNYTRDYTPRGYRYHHPSETRNSISEFFFEGKNTKDVSSTMGYTERYTRKKKYNAKNN